MITHRNNWLTLSVLAGVMMFGCLKDVFLSACWAQDYGQRRSYAAIALNSCTGRWAYTYNYPDRREAEEAALRRVGLHGRIILSTTARYFAFAQGPLGGWGTGTGDTYFEAATQALINARKHALAPELKFCQRNGPEE